MQYSTSLGDDRSTESNTVWRSAIGKRLLPAARLAYFVNYFIFKKKNK